MNKFIEIISLYDVVTPAASEVVKGKTYYAYSNEWNKYDVIDVYSQTWKDDDDDDDDFAIYFAELAYRVGKFHKKNFVTKAECRDKQIDSILDDE